MPTPIPGTFQSFKVRAIQASKSLSLAAVSRSGVSPGSGRTKAKARIARNAARTKLREPREDLWTTFMTFPPSESQTQANDGSPGTRRAPRVSAEIMHQPGFG